jgi:hypothetical protein
MRRGALCPGAPGLKLYPNWKVDRERGQTCTDVHPLNTGIRDRFA